MVRKRMSVRQAWLLSYILILLIPLLLGGYSYIQSYTTIRNETISYNTESIKIIKQNINEVISKMYTMQLAISRSSNVFELSKAKKIDADTQFMLYEVGRDMNLYYTDPSFKSFVYFEKIDRVVSDTSIHGLRTFYNIYYKKDVPFQEFNDRVHAVTSNKDIPVRNDSGDLLFTLPIAKGTYLFFIVRSDYIDRLVSNNYLTKDGILALLGQDGEPVFTSAPLDGIDPHLLWNGQTDKTGAMRANGTKYSVIRMDSTNLNYVFLVPQQVYMEKFVGVRNTLLLTVILIIVVGVFLIRILFRNNYAPVKGLVENIVYDRTKENEFSAISRALESMSKKNNELEVLFNKSEPIVRNSIITNLLRGRPVNHELAGPLMEPLGLEQPETKFMVISYSVENYGIFAEDSADDENNDELVTVSNFILSNVIGELINAKNKGIFSEIDSELVSIVSVRPENSKQIGKQLYETMAQAREFIQSNFGVTFYAGAGRLHDGPAGIAESYNESVDAVEYASLAGSRDVIYFADIKPPERYEYVYSRDREDNFIGLIKTGDFEQANRYMNAMIEEYMNSTGMSVSIFKCLIFDLASTLLRVYLETAEDNSDKNMETLGAILSGTVPDERAALEEMLHEVCEAVPRRSEVGSVSAEIKQYIDAHFDDAGLNINSIGDRLGFAPSYLSKMFKETYGDNMLNYINMTRMEKAKQLLTVSGATIEEIAGQVGISNKVTFIRLFKKHVGITPGKYRDINHNME